MGERRGITPMAVRDVAVMTVAESHVAGVAGGYSGGGCR